VSLLNASKLKISLSSFKKIISINNINYFMNIIQTIFEGILGGLTFGIYHHYTTMREIRKNNEKIEKQQIEYLKKHQSS